MDSQKVDMFLMQNQKNFDTAAIPMIKDKLLALDDDKFMMLSSAEFKNPTTLLIVSLLAGEFGVDRFILGDTGMGVLKLLTAGCFGVLTIIDWCTITKKTKEKNLEEFMKIVSL